MEGRDADETCTLLGITAENQRVLLHRARGRIRSAIDRLTSPTARTATTAARPSGARPSGVARLFARLARWAMPAVLPEVNWLAVVRRPI
jgi:hypothetical protein